MGVIFDSSFKSDKQLGVAAKMKAYNLLKGLEKHTHTVIISRLL